MNYQNPHQVVAKVVGAPMYSSTWLALFVLLRESLQ